MNIAYIGHGYHEKTRSTRFFSDFLRQHSCKFDLFADYSWVGGPSANLEEIAESGYDLIVVFQMERVAEWLARRVPERLIFIPMYDSVKDIEPEFWAAFEHARVLNFSYVLHELSQKAGLPSLRVQYFPDPSAFMRADFSDFRGFLWQRRQEIAWPLIKRLAAGTKFKNFALHLAVDPEYGEPCGPEPDDIKSFNIALSRWYEDRAELDQVLTNSNIYFAPRLCEGIGMSFLEAMARGQCVVAPDAPTMSEYITNGISGLLYDEKHPHVLDFSKAAAMGAAARRKVERGYAQWQKDQRELLPEFIFHGRENAIALLKHVSHAQVRDRDEAHHTAVPGPPVRVEGGRRLRRSCIANRTDEPLVSVAIVTRNARRTFCSTLESVLSQTYGNVEVLVVDGASQDGTKDIIADNDEAIDYWLSEPDQGPYDGMNKAARLARGAYVIYMNAGDLFAYDNSLAEAMTGISEKNEPDFIIGHHIYVTTGNVEEFHRANDFADTWRAMREGTYSFKWLSGVPCHQATLTRAALLRDNPYDLSWRIAADHELMYRMRAKGASFHHCDATLAIYSGGGFSAQHEALCFKEWRQLACVYGDRQQAELWFDSWMNLDSKDSVTTSDTRVDLFREIASKCSTVFASLAQRLRNRAS